MALTQVSRGLLSTSIVDNGNDTAITIDSSENVLVGKTSTDNTTQGIRFYPTGRQSIVSEADTALIVNRRTSDGHIAEFRKDGTAVGRIGAYDGRPYLASTTVGIRISNALFPSNTSGVITDGAMNIGGSSGRFKDLYLSGGAYLGGTGSANKLDDYEEGTFTPTSGVRL